MAASPNSCNGPPGSLQPIELLQQGAPSTLHFPLLKSLHGSHDFIRTSSGIASNNNRACRLASVAVAATAWVGLSMWPLEVLAMAMVYETADHLNVGELVTSPSMGALKHTGGDFVDNASISNLVMPEMETLLVGNVPSIEPPNEGLNSPWVPRINRSKKNNESIKRRMMKCPPWTISELEMVLPDLQGKPKPFPHLQGQVYPFWPATIVGGEDSEDDNIGGDKEKLKLLSQATSSTPIDGVHDTDDPTTKNPASPPPQQDQMPMKKARSCFTM